MLIIHAVRTNTHPRRRTILKGYQGWLQKKSAFFVIEVGVDLACIGWVTVYNSNMLLGRIVRFYVEGFRSMTLGRTLWGIILLKLFIMFAVLKAFFFPSYLQGGEQEKGDTVLTELTNRAAEEE